MRDVASLSTPRLYTFISLTDLNLVADTAPVDNIACAAEDEPAPSATLPRFSPSVSPQHYYAATPSAAPAELVAFAHAALFSPALSTLTIALERGYVPACMGLTNKTLRKHPPQSVAMVKGRLDQARKNQRPSAKATTTNADHTANPHNDAFPISEPTNSRIHQCFAAVFEPATGQIHSNQTGKFIVASSTGDKYVLVVCDYDLNYILVEPFAAAKALVCWRPSPFCMHV
jgi:hypothetical protein